MKKTEKNQTTNAKRHLTVMQFINVCNCKDNYIVFKHDGSIKTHNIKVKLYAGDKRFTVSKLSNIPLIWIAKDLYNGILAFFEENKYFHSNFDLFLSSINISNENFNYIKKWAEMKI